MLYIHLALIFILFLIFVFIVSYVIGGAFTKGKMDVLYEMARKNQIRIGEEDDE